MSATSSLHRSGSSRLRRRRAESRSSRRSMRLARFFAKEVYPTAVSRTASPSPRVVLSSAAVTPTDLRGI